MALARPAAAGQFVFVAIAFGALEYAFLTDDFSVAVRRAAFELGVARVLQSHGGLGRPRRLDAAVDHRARGLDDGRRGGQPLAAAGVRESRARRARHRERRHHRVRVAHVESVHAARFRRPLDGNDLNPLLQDPGMIIHPPTLYLGYVGMAVPFAFAVAALLTGRLDKNWARWTRPWTIVGVDVPDGRHHARQLVGVLRARLGRLVVLGSRRELVVHAVADGDGVAALAGRDGAARHLQELDGAARDRRVLVELARHVPDAFAGA